jgi:hypothetical protein
MDIEGYKGLLKWLRYLNKYLNIDLRDLLIHFLDGTVISDSTDNPDNSDNTKVLTSGSLSDIINQNKETVK